MRKSLMLWGLLLVPVMAFALPPRQIQESFREKVSVPHSGCKGDEECYALAKRLESKAKEKVRRELAGACQKVADGYGARKGKTEAVYISDVDILQSESDASQASFLVSGEIHCVIFYND